MLARAELTFPRIDPVAISIGPFQARWYALAYVVGLLFAFWYMKRLVSNPALWNGKPPAMPPLLGSTISSSRRHLGSSSGAGWAMCSFYDPAYFATHPLDIVKLWQGGMSFHGGFLGVIVACWAFARWKRLRLDQILDLAAAAVPVGLGLGRLANFINGELFGRVSDVPWAMVFPAWRAPSPTSKPALRGRSRRIGPVLARPHCHPSLPCPRPPGPRRGAFRPGLRFIRILVELFREPDAHIGYLAGFITRGMLLSLPMILIGIWLLLRSRRT